MTCNTSTFLLGLLLGMIFATPATFYVTLSWMATALNRQGGEEIFSLRDMIVIVVRYLLRQDIKKS